ncbi:MAG: type II toxin-antitoxin system VapC family toxin [Burkholderiales bacterium]|nr:type II toxin-antitoxin system VapC family toxin [Burkholderiales bacterium]
MIGLDTNVLVRILVRDHAGQAERARRFFDANDANPPSFLVNDVVLAELVWVLQSLYEFGAADIARAIRSLLDNASIAFEASDVVASALERYEQSRVGFADCLIAAKNAARGCAFTATFDRSMQILPAVKVI